MNVDDTKRSRAALKTYFVKNAIPTEGQFAEFIDSVLNQRDDGLVKTAGDPLSIEAAGDDASFKKALNFYTSFSDATPAWTVALKPRTDNNTPSTVRPGLSINDAAGNSRLCINSATGQVGVGVVDPGEPLEVAGRVKAGGLTIGPWLPDGSYMFVGANSLDQSSETNYAMLQGTSGPDRGRTFLNSPLDIHFRIGNSDRMVLTGDGLLSIGASDPKGFRLFLPGRDGGDQKALAILADQNISTKDLGTLIRIGSDGDYQMVHKAADGGNFQRSMLGFHCATGDSLGFFSSGWTRLLEVAGGTGDTYVRGQLTIGGGTSVTGDTHLGGQLEIVGGATVHGNSTVIGDSTVGGHLQVDDSAVYFMGNGSHQHVGYANSLGHAAIENATGTYNALMILGRMVDATTTTPQRRVVKVWDYLEMNGDMVIDGTLNGHGADIAEVYVSRERLQPGDVVSLDRDRDEIIATPIPDHDAVIGVISSRPGFLLGARPEDDDMANTGCQNYPVALCGRVPCKVTDEGGPIRRGDLLTSASRPGHAMRARTAGPEGVFRSGTIVGKALGSHAEGEGVVDIFVTLQ
jgi:hypothetical protein